MTGQSSGDVKKTMAWRIREWQSRYEPALRGHPNRGRRGLDWFRCPVAARRHTRGWRRLLQLCGEEGELIDRIRPFHALGLFVWCCEMVAECDAKDRDGTIYDDDGNPASLEWIATEAGVPVADVHEGLCLLTDKRVGWIEQIDNKSGKIGQNQSKSVMNGFNREKSGNIGINREISRLDRDRDEEGERDRDRLPKIDSSKPKRACQAPNPDLSESFSGGSSVSVSGERRHTAMIAVRAKTILDLVKLLNTKLDTKQGNADKTTFEKLSCDLIVGPGKKEAAQQAKAITDLAKTYAGKGRKPVAMFLAACKRELGWRAR